MRSSFYLECSGYGGNQSISSRGSYLDPPIIDGTTEEILYLRKQVHGLNNKASRLAKGPHHWLNIPSGAEYQSNFEKKYPEMRSGYCNSEYDPSFPYERLKPVPQKPASDLLLYSNTNTYSHSFACPRSSCGNQSYIAQSRPSCSRHRCDEDRIRKALQHIDNASKILENY